MPLAFFIVCLSLCWLAAPASVKSESRASSRKKKRRFGPAVRLEKLELQSVDAFEPWTLPPTDISHLSPEPHRTKAGHQRHLLSHLRPADAGYFADLGSNRDRAHRTKT